MIIPDERVEIERSGEAILVSSPFGSVIVYGELLVKRKFVTFPAGSVIMPLPSPSTTCVPGSLMTSGEPDTMPHTAPSAIVCLKTTLPLYSIVILQVA